MNDNPMIEFMSDFNRIRQTIKDPRQEVQNLLNSGQMSQQDFNRLSQNYRGFKHWEIGIKIA